ncbi:TetR/AcrR family transcriptional regulator [Paenarthrobacter sp. NPDC090520]|uniref:TetR/AcrR family transcriptional regulator n=1 Tax=Paenarthrobacter sp. NPDC090520 TaxID=3364382 RepID=UPI003820ABB5
MPIENTSPTARVRSVKDPTHTRRAIIDAAVELLIQGGKPAPLDRVAAAAGVSKGGLLHHFSSQAEISIAVCEESSERLWTSVHELIEPDDQTPGRVLRAYVRALLGESQGAVTAFMHMAALLFFRDNEAVHNIARADADRWRQAFEVDGVPFERWLLVRFAAEGAVACVDSPYIDEVEQAALRRTLLELAEIPDATEERS